MSQRVSYFSYEAQIRHYNVTELSLRITFMSETLMNTKHDQSEKHSSFAMTPYMKVDKI